MGDNSVYTQSQSSQVLVQPLYQVILLIHVTPYELTCRFVSYICLPTHWQGGISVFSPNLGKKNFPFRSRGLFNVPRSYAVLTFCLWQSFPRQGNWCWVNGQTKCDSEDSSEDNMNGLCLTSTRSRLVVQSFVAKTGSWGLRKWCPSGRSGMVSQCVEADCLECE